MIEQIYEFKIQKNQTPERIDSFLTRQILNATRTKIQKSIDKNLVEVDGKSVKASKKVMPGENIICKIMKLPPIELLPQNIPLDVIYEDDYLLIVNKPAGMCSHPGIGNRYGTLINALLYHFGYRESIQIELSDEEEDIEESPELIFTSDRVRPGLVHRIDKDTSGLLVISKNLEIHNQLQSQFVNRTISREYHTIVWGTFEKKEGRIEGDIGRSARDRKKFAVVTKGGKHAITDYWVEKEYQYCSLLKVKLHTGRTHQIRVHLSNIKHNVVGDKMYGGDSIIFGLNNPRFKQVATNMLKTAQRQMLHAKKLTLFHPILQQTMTFDSELPEDFSNVIKYLEKFSENN